MAEHLSCAVACGNILGEGPVWDAAENALFWVDIVGRLVQRLDLGSGRVTASTVPERVSALALRRNGGLILALASGFAFFDPATNALERLASPDADRPGNRFNDGKCDARGRFWAGTMDDQARQRSGSLYRFDGDRSCRSMASGIGISNSLAWNPENSIFYFADTLQGHIYAYDFDLDAGALSNRRLFADTADQPGAPDGSTVDADGCLWNAQWGGARLVRYAPDGRIDRIVALPVDQPTSCMFGGPDLGTLFVTSARIGLSPRALEARPWAGHVLALDVGVRGCPAARFAG